MKLWRSLLDTKTGAVAFGDYGKVPPYKENKMNFGEALHALKNGKEVARAGWNGKNMFLFLVPGSQFEVNRKPLSTIFAEGTIINYHAHIDMRTADGYIVPWLASQTDILAEDWSCVYGVDGIYTIDSQPVQGELF